MLSKLFSKLTKLILLCVTISEQQAPADNLKKNDQNDMITVTTLLDNQLPYLSSSVGASFLPFYNAVLGRMLVLDKNFDFTPGTLESYSWDFERKGYILRAKNNLAFSTGRKVTAEDLEFSITRFFYTKGRSDQSAFLSMIEGVDKIKRGDVFINWRHTGVEKIDDRTILVKTGSPNPSFLYALCEGWIGIVPIESLEKDYITWKTYPIGVGPYKVSQIDGSDVILERIYESKNNKPKFIRFSTNKGRNADFYGYFGSNPFKGIFVEINKDIPYGYLVLAFNQNTELGRKREFREAIENLVDRSKISLVSGGSSKELFELLPKPFWGRIDSERKPNLEKSKQILSSLNIGKNLEIDSDLDVNDEVFKSIHLEIQKQFRDVSINAIIKNRTNGQPRETLKSPISLLRVGMISSDSLARFQSFGPNGLYKMYLDQKDNTFSHLLKNASQQYNKFERASSTKIISKYFFDEYKAVPLVQLETKFYFNPQKISGLDDINNFGWLDLEKINFKKGD